MKCPYCEKEIPGINCSQCGSVSPEGAKFCMECGVSLGEEAEDSFEGENDFDFSDRILCPDGTCTGIIIDGRCSECGKTPEEAERQEEQREEQQEEQREEQQEKEKQEKEINKEEK
jgi:hypothetical protein